MTSLDTTKMSLCNKVVLYCIALNVPHCSSRTAVLGTYSNNLSSMEYISTQPRERTHTYTRAHTSSRTDIHTFASKNEISQTF